MSLLVQLEEKNDTILHLLLFSSKCFQKDSFSFLRSEWFVSKWRVSSKGFILPLDNTFRSRNVLNNYEKNTRHKYSSQYYLTFSDCEAVTRSFISLICSNFYLRCFLQDLVLDDRMGSLTNSVIFLFFIVPNFNHWFMLKNINDNNYKTIAVFLLTSKLGTDYK